MDNLRGQAERFGADIEKVREENNVADIGEWDSDKETADKWWHGRGIVAQAAVPVLPDDAEDALAA